MMGRLDGLVAIVTGAARGQGEAEARLFAAEGAKVILTDVLSEKGAEIANEIGPNAKFLRQDVGSAEGWNEVVAEALSTFGRIDILVNNAAIVRPLRLEATEPSDYDEMYRVNQFGVYLGMRAVIEPMKRQGRGSIINISSVAGLTGTSSLFAYSATKWAVRGMTRSAAKELARYKIRVNGIFPGVIDTPMNDGNSDKMNQGMIQATPLRRMGEVDEIAQAVLYFASPSAAFTTGAELAIDGGLSA
jgi:3alpha(or 20beta)-hydroxysteroid dehydrogenase